MNPENLSYLQSKRTKLKYLVQSQSGQLDASERENFQRIIREEFWPGYQTDLWCSSCAFKMVELLHQKFEEWLSIEEARQKLQAETAAIEAEVKPEEPLVVAASFPVNEKPLDGSMDKTEYQPKRKNHKRR